MIANIGLPANENDIEAAVSKHSFEAKSGHKPGEERKDSCFRKGIVGKWESRLANSNCKGKEQFF